MCGRFSILTPDDILEKRFKAKVQEPLFHHYNAAPSQKLPVITNDQPEAIRLGLWGLRPKWLKRDKHQDGFINARAETLLTKPSFRAPFKKRRCLIIADGFFEWQRGRPGGKQPYRITLKNDEPFAFAGLWELYQTKPGRIIPSFAIITTNSNSLVASVHNRMPVMLDKKDEQYWIDDEAKTDDLMNLLKPYPERQLKLFPVSHLVNSPSVDVPEVIQPIELDSWLP
ncbi:SOS response-associated peptidase [Patescibacteria group bacterium]